MFSEQRKMVLIVIQSLFWQALRSISVIYIINSLLSNFAIKRIWIASWRLWLIMFVVNNRVKDSDEWFSVGLQVVTNVFIQCMTLQESLSDTFTIHFDFLLLIYRTRALRSSMRRSMVASLICNMRSPSSRMLRSWFLVICLFSMLIYIYFGDVADANIINNHYQKNN